MTFLTPEQRRPIFDAVKDLGVKFNTQIKVDRLDRGITESLALLGVVAQTPPPVVTARRTGLRNPSLFFESAKALLGSLSQSEVDGCNAVLDACGAASYPIGDTAYALGTTYHETGGTMQPIKEYGGNAYFKRMYDVQGSRPTLARKNGNVRPGDGVKYPGRGYVQLTWHDNYKRADKILRERGFLKSGENLLENPDLVMRPDIAAAIMVFGMREGWFTGRDLDDDIPRQGPATYEQFFRSRDIINGTDKQAKIAGEAVIFQKGLLAGNWTEL